MDESFHSSQESDILPPEFKHLVTTELVDIIRQVQNEEPFEDSQPGIDEGHSVLDVQPILEETQPFFQMAPPVQLMSSPTCAMPATDEYPGPFGFEIQLDGRSAGKHWVFSHDLFKLYVTMNTAIHLGFKCESYPSDLYVRALPVYCQSEAFQEPVISCLYHRNENKHPEGFSGEVLYHVLWIDHAQAVYEYDEISERRSVLVPLGHPQVGSDWVTVALKFMCKNSCISGMNRRATEVIFTLEDSRRAVLGRRKIKVRVCSCPKRDKTKDEEDAKIKTVNPVSRGKRAAARKTEEDNAEGMAVKLGKFDDHIQVPVPRRVLSAVVDFARYKVYDVLRTEKREATDEEKTLLQFYSDVLSLGSPDFQGSVSKP